MQSIFSIKSILKEYGFNWAFNRTLYAAKLQLLRRLPKSELLFEKSVTVKRTDVFRTDTVIIEEFLSNLSQADINSILNIADDAASGKILGFSSILLNYGYPIDWQLNPLSGKSCLKSEKWYRISDFDSDRGDIKLIWEASRFTHFYYFARAFMLTRDRKYYNAFSQQLAGWLENNPYSFGANYKCGQECALRMINALRAYSVFESYKLCDSTDKKNITELISRCYRKILSNFFYAHKCIKNNHTLSELCGMIVGAWCCEDEKKLNKAYQLLDKEIEVQFTPDGGYVQYSFNYQRLALQICECIISLSNTLGHTLSDTSIERIRNSALLMYQCQNDSGDMPNYGSNDGALIFPVTSCGYRDFRPVINTIFALTAGNRLYECGPYDEELLWFGSNDCPIEKLERKSETFSEAGLFTLRNGDCFVMACLNDYGSRPAHMDQLHIDLWYKGINIFSDGGTYSYASNLGSKLVCTESHNTVKVAQKEQMNKRSSFLICDWSKAQLIQSDDSTFEGLMVSQNGYSHRRKLDLVDKTLLVTDDVNGTDDYEILFHTPLNVSICEDEAYLLDNGKLLCTVKCTGCEMYTDIGYRSLYYLTSSQITVLHIKGTQTAMNIRIEIGDAQKND